MDTTCIYVLAHVRISDQFSTGVLWALLNSTAVQLGLCLSGAQTCHQWTLGSIPGVVTWHRLWSSGQTGLMGFLCILWFLPTVSPHRNA